MLNLILVCGLARCSTNSVSGYVHMSDNVMSFQGGPDPTGVSLASNQEILSWLEDMDPQVVAGTAVETDIYMASWYYSKVKKARWLAGHNLNDYTYYAKRQDFIETMGIDWDEPLKKLDTSKNSLEVIADNPLINLKLLYCMRPDLRELYASRRGNSYTETPQQFCSITEVSYGRILQLRDYGVPVCPVSLSEGQEEYDRVDRFLGLEPSLLQQCWKAVNLKTNAAGPVNKRKRAYPEPDPETLTAFSKIQRLYGQVRGELL